MTSRETSGIHVRRRSATVNTGAVAYDDGADPSTAAAAAAAGKIAALALALGSISPAHAAGAFLQQRNI